MKNSQRVFWVVLTAAVFGATTADAASGAVRRQFRYWEHNGGYCDATIEEGRTCTGATYTAATYDTPQPLKSMKVYLVRDSDNAVIGQASTGSDGFATVAWSTLPWEPAPVAHFDIKFEHSSDRFVVKSGSGGTVTGFTANFQTINGTTTTAPQLLGTATWGSSSTSNNYADLYGGATRSWESLNDSSRVVNTFTGLQIWAFVSTGTVARPKSNRVEIHSLQADDQFAISHEMAHVAEYKVNNFDVRSNMCFNGELPRCSHDMFSAENRSVTYNEGFADFAGGRSIYGQSATMPVACIVSDGPCFFFDSATSMRMETTTGSGSCVTNEGRFEASIARYMWDIYDDNADYTGETLNRSFATFFDIFAAWPAGIDDHQKDEPWDAFGSVDTEDGHSGSDFRFVALNNYSAPFDSNTVRTANCSP